MKVSGSGSLSVLPLAVTVVAANTDSDNPSVSARVVTICLEIDEFESFRLDGACVGDPHNNTLEELLLCASGVLQRVQWLRVALEVRVSDDFPVQLASELVFYAT